jgi:N6-adenosine-specific RNA methylase IME4
MNKLPSRIVAGLPGTLEGLREYVLLSGEKLKAYKLVLKSANRQGAKEIYEQTLAEAQIVGESTLYAEARMGEMLERIPKQGDTLTSRGGRKATLPSGLDHKASHHAQQLARNPEAIKEAIAEAKERGEIPTRRDVLGLIRRNETETKHAPKNTSALPEGVYSCIYADPPWRFGDGTTDPGRAIEQQYPTLSLDEIKALPVSGIAAPDCVLFLWTTAPLLSESIEVIPAWGFQYKSCAVWDKERIGMGHYFRIQHELLLIATRGSPGTPADNLLQSSVYREKRGKHSVKPEWFRKTIERYYPSAQRIELFARRESPGWATWGDQAP